MASNKHTAVDPEAILAPASDLDDLCRRAGTLLRSHALSAFTLGIAPLRQGRVDPRRARLLSTLPAAFQTEYRQRSLASFDPVFEFMAGRYAPFTKSSLSTKLSATPGHRPVLETADRHVLGDALMVPLNSIEASRGVVLFSSEEPAVFAAGLRDRLGDLLRLAHALMSRAEALGFAEMAIESASLSRREVECLQWLAIGRDHVQTAQALGISVRTVRFHLGNARRKLGVRRAAEAIARAVRLGLVHD